MTQMARSRQPGDEASAFMPRLSPTQATLRVRARRACLPSRATAMPSAAKITAPTSGMPASSAAITALCLTDRTRTYWASQLTTAAAAARTASASIAPRSQACARSPGSRPAGAGVITVRFAVPGRAVPVGPGWGRWRPAVLAASGMAMGRLPFRPRGLGWLDWRG